MGQIRPNRKIQKKKKKPHIKSRAHIRTQLHMASLGPQPPIPLQDMTHKRPIWMGPLILYDANLSWEIMMGLRLINLIVD